MNSNNISNAFASKSESAHTFNFDLSSGHFAVKQFWSDNQQQFFDKIFATAKGKQFCYNLAKGVSIVLPA